MLALLIMTALVKLTLFVTGLDTESYLHEIMRYFTPGLDMSQTLHPYTLVICTAVTEANFGLVMM